MASPKPVSQYLPHLDTPMSMPTAVALPTAADRAAQMSSHLDTPMPMPTDTPLPSQVEQPTTHAGQAPLYNAPTSARYPSMTLYYHPLSPFVRKVWITALELSLTHLITLHKVVVAPVIAPKGYPGWSENNELVGTFNPINKIPTLVVKYDGEDEFAVYDSKVICEFLGNLAGKQVDTRDITYWKRQTLHRAADQMLDSEILVAYEERIREPEGIYFKPWVDGMRQKIVRGFDVLHKAVQDGTLPAWSSSRDEVGLEEVAVVCCLGFMDQRGIEWRDGREGLKWWFEEWKERRSYKGSKWNVEWVGKKTEDRS